MKYFSENIIDAKSLTIEEWLKYLLSKKRDRIFPDNCFPTNDLQTEYLSQIRNKSDEEVKAILRRFLVQTGNFGKDKIYAESLIQANERKELIEIARSSEYHRRLLSKRPTWEGITWILDLLPEFPNETLKALDAYFLANCQVLPDYSLNGLSHASTLIAAKYIDFEHPQEVFLNLSPIEFEWLVEELYKCNNYETQLTKKSHDGGIDIIGTKVSNSEKETVLIQCKRYTKKITVREVRELSGSLQDYPIRTGVKATKGVLVTSSEFTRSAKKEFDNNHTIELIDYKILSKQLNRHLGTYWVSRLNRIFWNKRKGGLCLTTSKYHGC